jgi:uncharacterized membrane protein YqaE (UPF0057 family)
MMQIKVPGTSIFFQVVTTQPVAGVVTVGTRPPDYLIPSILACLCCFWPTGIFAIYYALRVNHCSSFLLDILYFLNKIAKVTKELSLMNTSSN